MHILYFQERTETNGVVYYCVVCKFCLDLPVLGGQSRRKQKRIKHRYFLVEIKFTMTIDVWLYNSGFDTAQCTSGQPLQQTEVCTMWVSTDYASNLLPPTLMTQCQLQQQRQSLQQESIPVKRKQ